MDIIKEFCQRVKETPHKTAIIENDIKIQYSQLEELAFGYAENFTKKTQQPKVLILLPQSINAYASMIGTLMAGGYYCPININLPDFKILEITKLFAPDIILTTSELDIFKNSHRKSLIIYTENIFSRKTYEIKTAHKLSYIIFTSGSTGAPKGVMIKRSAVSKFVKEFRSITNVNGDDKWGQFSSIGFDLSVVDIYTCLTAGATLYAIVNQTERILPAHAIQKYKLTIWHSVPSVIDLMKKSNQITNEYLSSLKLMSFCGEPLYPCQVENLFNANKSMKILNTYGPTEGTLFCTYQELNHTNFGRFCDGTVAIGNPISGWELHINTSNCNNEIVIKGENIGQGYLNNKEETKKRFKKENPNTSEYSTFYTGDTAYLKENNIYFKGRIDNQVKISGNRVELGHIDSVIRSFGISQCCTVFYKHKLYAFTDINSVYDEVELLNFLKKRLTNFQIPHHFIKIHKFPKNINDKVNRKELIKLIKNEEH